MATIRLRKDSGMWQGIIRRKGHPRLSETFKTNAEAKQWAAIKESEIARGVFVGSGEAERMTLGDLIDRFTKEYAPFHYRKRADEKEAWRYQCKRLNEKLGEYSLSALDQKIAAKYRDDRLEEVGESTVRKEIFMLSKILGFGEIECGIALPRGNPTKKIRKPSEGKGRDRRLTANQMSRLLRECAASRNLYLLPAVEIALETGMRQGEILALQWSDVKIKEGLLYVRESKGDTTEDQGRIVPMSDNTIETLKRLPGDHKAGAVIPLERLTLYHAYIAAVKRAKIKDFDYHDLRHEALSRIGEIGDLSTREMMQMSGHKTVRMVTKYQHADVKKIREKLKTKDKEESVKNIDIKQLIERASKDPKFAKALADFAKQ